MNRLTLASYQPATIEIDCSQETHHLRWHAGELTAVDHHDPAIEKSLAEMSGQPSRCLGIVDSWSLHSDDLSALLLGPRAPTDKIANFRPDTKEWPFPSLPETDLLALLTVNPVLSRLLMCTVAQTWTKRIHEQDFGVDDHRAALSAALFGRVVPAIRTWLDDDNLDVRVHMTEERRQLVRYSDRVDAFLPFDWIVEVWGLAITSISGSFVLAADAPAPNQVALSAIGTDFCTRTTINVTTIPE